MIGLLKQGAYGLHTGSENMEVVEKQDVEDLEKSLDVALQFFSVHLPNIVGEEIGAFLIVEIYGNYLKFPGPLDSRRDGGNQNAGQQPTVGLNVLINM